VSNLLAERVYARATRAVRVRYEDLVTEPGETLSRIGECIGEDLSGVAADLAAGRPLPRGHAIAGNRMRMQREVRLTPDLAWRDGLGRRDRIVSRLIAGRVAARYGY
jgi:hypothetical protein